MRGPTPRATRFFKAFALSRMELLPPRVYVKCGKDDTLLTVRPTFEDGASCAPNPPRPQRNSAQKWWGAQPSEHPTTGKLLTLHSATGQTGNNVLLQEQEQKQDWDSRNDSAGCEPIPVLLIATDPNVHADRQRPVLL